MTHHSDRRHIGMDRFRTCDQPIACQDSEFYHYATSVCVLSFEDRMTEVMALDLSYNLLDLSNAPLISNLSTVTMCIDEGLLHN